MTLSIGSPLRGARLVVVGGTGFLGKVWLAMLLHRYPEIGKVFLVVRPKEGRDSEARRWSEVAPSAPFDALRAERPGAEFEAYLSDKIEVLHADVSQPLCAVDPAVIDALNGTIDAVVNVAGVVDFNSALDEALLANAFGVQNLVELAKALGNAPVVHTSTAYVAGYRQGQINEGDPRDTPFPKGGSLEAGERDDIVGTLESRTAPWQWLPVMSTALTQGIRVTVNSQYLSDRSSPAARQYVFAYTVRIANEGTETAQLRSRHWIITDGEGKVQEVRGDGVIGAQPVLKPGQHFEYTSGCVLTTPRGTMEGTYQMVRDAGDRFDAQIAPFPLAMPHSIN